MMCGSSKSDLPLTEVLCLENAIPTRIFGSLTTVMLRTRTKLMPSVDDDIVNSRSDTVRPL